MTEKFKMIGFDADDTLWMNENYYREAEAEFCTLMSDYCSKETAEDIIFKTEVRNLDLYGYGAKGFTLSMIEAARLISDEKVTQETIGKILQLGKDLINKPLILLDGVEETLKALSSENIKLIVVTKGDLLDQERKLANSHLEDYFQHIEIMSDKKSLNYQKMLSFLNISPEKFLMIGNSLKSDVIPVLELGGYAIHVPYHTTWQHEEAGKIINERFKEIEHISQLKGVLNQWRK